MNTIYIEYTYLRILYYLRETMIIKVFKIKLSVYY